MGRIPTSSRRGCTAYPKGTTALGLAAYYGLDNLIPPLMAAKADPNVADDSGMTPLTMAKAYEFEACAALMQGKIGETAPIPHSGIEGKMDNVFVLIQSDVKGAQNYLNKLKNGLDYLLERRKIRHLICVVDPLSLDEKADVTRMEAFNAKYILVWSETGAEFTTGERSSSNLNATLSLRGEATPIWKKDMSVNVAVRIFCDEDVIVGRALSALLDELEGDRLL